MKLNAFYKKTFLLLTLFASSIVFSQERVINLGDFDMIKVYSGMTLELIKSDEQKIVIKGEKKENVTVKNTNGKLKVYLNFPELFDEKVKVKLFYKDEINILDVNEGAAIYSDEVFKQNNLTVRSQEGAFLHLILDVKNVSVRTITGGSIRLRGTVVNQEVEATSGGIYQSYELNSEQAEVTAASGARAEVKVTSVLDAKVRFGGKIFYKGNPEKVSTKTIFGGTILNKG